MARPIDPALRAARRTQIIDAGLTAFAKHGAATTTAQICTIAEIASGTFFHHFPTKDMLVVAIVEYGVTETKEFFSARHTEPPLQVITDFVDQNVEELADTRSAGVIQAIAAMVHRAPIAQALRAQEEVVKHLLASVVRNAQESHLVREDIDAERLAAWVLLIIDGYTGAVAGGSIDNSKDAILLHEQVRLLLARQF
ncbi:hypothetical protein GCM10009720_20590 [Yaniella flava]|uniref:HTH tetR-type domain-containing protein n=1 Tax=Yaniella flava TaxID=287930 RepID=A0ABP5G5M4_9MICC|nr:TetR/AcrR family transcriptional regulator [Micrococcaceae bacterium]